jgi:hypothetical protein
MRTLKFLLEVYMYRTAGKYLRIAAVFFSVLVLGFTSLACANTGAPTTPWYDDTEPDTTDWYTDDEPETTTKPDTTDIAPLAPIDVSVDKSIANIGKEGGEVALDNGATLTVMANALPKTASISLEQFKNPDDFGQDATAFEISGLSGLTGNTELSFTVDEGLTEKEMAVYGYNPDTKKYFTLPFIYDSPGSQVTVTINPSTTASAMKSNNHPAPADQPQYDVQMIIAQDSVKSSASQAGVFERLKVLFTPQKAYLAAHTEYLIQMPFYEQTGGACWAADSNMIIAGFNPGQQRQHVGNVLSSVKASDDDFGLAASWVNYQELLPRYLSVQTSAGVSWRGFGDLGHLRWRMLQELDAGHPIILELPGLGHYILVIGYQNSGESFIIHDSRGTSPVDTPAPEGGMYTVRPWSWIQANKGGTFMIVHIMWPEATPCPDSLLSLGCPGGSENGGGTLGQALFYFINPKINHQVPVATLQYHPSSMNGVRWQEKLATVTVIPNTATNFALSTKVFNAAFQTDSAEVKIQVRRNADVFFTRSLGTVQLPAADYNTTSPVTVTVDIPTSDFRDLAHADANGQLPVSIDVMLMQGNTIADSFTVEATLDVTPIIDSINPTSVRPGDVLTIIGSCFGKTETSNSEVVIDDVTMEVLTWSDTQITLKIPEDFDSSGEVALNVNTGDRFTYESNFVPLTASTSKPFQLTRNWNITSTSTDEVMNGKFDWSLSGSGDYVIDSEKEGEITIKVLPGVPMRLAVNSYATAQSIQEKIPASSGDWYFVRTYNTPQLYNPTEDYMLDVSGNFVHKFSISGGNVNVDFTFSEEFDSFELYVVYCVYYDETLYDAEGVAQDIQSNELSYIAVKIFITVEAYDPAYQ